MSSKPFTLVFNVKDKAVFQQFIGQFTQAMAKEIEVHGACVTAAGWEDSMTRADKLVELMDEEGCDVPDDLR